MNSDPNQANSFSVHLGSLEDFRQSLETQLNVFDRPSGQLRTLSQTVLPLGAFNEAGALAEHYYLTLQEISTLADKWRQAVEFARNVTVAVEDGYRQAQQGAARAFASAANGGVSAPSGVSATATAPGPPGVYGPASVAGAAGAYGPAGVAGTAGVYGTAGVPITGTYSAPNIVSTPATPVADTSYPGTVYYSSSTQQPASPGITPYRSA